MSNYFTNCCTFLHFHQQCVKIPLVPYPCHNVVLSWINFSHSREYILELMISIYISLITNDAEASFMYLLAVFTTSLIKCKGSLCILIWALYQVYIYYAFSPPVLGLSFHFPNYVFQRREDFNIDEVKFISFLFMVSWLCVYSDIFAFHPQRFPSTNFTVSCLIFRSVIDFEIGDSVLKIGQVPNC